jgi:hypothetical protein
MHLCSCQEKHTHNSLYQYGNETFFKHNLHRETKKNYIQLAFLLSLSVFHIIKQRAFHAVSPQFNNHLTDSEESNILWVLAYHLHLFYDGYKTT